MKTVLAMRLHDGTISVSDSLETKLKLPEGCIGILLVFESKKAAKKYCGAKTELVELEFKEDIKCQ